MKSKFIIMTLTLLLFLTSLVGCGSEDQSSDSNTSGNDAMQNEDAVSSNNASSDNAYYGKSSGSTIDIIEISDLPTELQDNIPLWYQNSIIVTMTQWIYNTETSETRVVNLFAKPGEEGYGSLKLGENEKYFSFTITLVSKDDAATVTQYYASNFNKATYMEKCYDVPVPWGLGNHFAYIESAEEIDYRYLDPFDFADLAYTEDDINTFNQFLQAEGYQTYISLGSEWVPQ